MVARLARPRPSYAAQVAIRGWCCASPDVEDDVELRFVQIRDAGLSDVGVRVDENEGKRAHDTHLTNSLLYRSRVIPYHLPI